MSQQVATPMIDVDKIDVEEGFNPRTHMDSEALTRLAESLKKTGVVQPLAVRPAKGGRFIVVAGHRRLKAAEIAGIEQVPVHLCANGNASTAALVENLHREDLDPIDTARGLQALAEELGLTTHKKIAEELEVSDSWVSQHLRLLNLPEGVQSFIAQGDVPVEAERDLRKIAEVSPRIAECVCELAKRKKVKGRDFVRHFDELFLATAEARFENPPTMIPPRAVRISQVVTEPKKRRDLGDRYRVLHPHGIGEPAVRLGEVEIDAARAAGCLVKHTVDHGEFSSVHAFITDAELAADLTERAVEREEKEAAKRKKEEEEWRAKAAGRDPAETPEQKTEARKAAYRERQEKAAEARSWNQEVGRKLLQRRGGSSRKEHALARAKALVLLILHDNPKLAASGLRLTMDQLQDVEVKQLKTTGKAKEKVSYAEPEDCAKYLEKRVIEARSVNEVLELGGDAVIAAWLADEDELPQSKRSHGSIYDPQVEKLLGADIKSVRPRRQRRKSRK
jgi:ParB/RepB/Spo0J family partition protein